MNTPRAVILSCSGPDLTAAERAFFRDANPLGFILFQRNCITPDQVKRLVDDLRSSIGRDDAPVLIDQEGGRVQRLKPPHWRDAPSAQALAATSSPAEAVRLNARLIAYDLLSLGITVDCAPVLDLPQPHSDPIIGDRAYGTDPDRVIWLAQAACQGFLEGGVLAVIKHMPGHGRALVDSHEALPVVDTPAAALTAHDFKPFAAFPLMPWAMTAHVVYTDIDPEHPATTSRTVIDQIIRGHMGFEGALMSDDISMKALKGSLGERTRDALAAGCDVVLYCHGVLADMQAVCADAPSLQGEALNRVQRAAAMRTPADDFDPKAALARLQSLLIGAS